MCTGLYYPLKQSCGRLRTINIGHAAQCLLSLVCIHVLSVELSSYYGLTCSKVTGDTNCHELLRQNLSHRRNVWHPIAKWIVATEATMKGRQGHLWQWARRTHVEMAEGARIPIESSVPQSVCFPVTNWVFGASCRAVPKLPLWHLLCIFPLLPADTCWEGEQSVGDILMALGFSFDSESGKELIRPVLPRNSSLLLNVNNNKIRKEAKSS